MKTSNQEHAFNAHIEKGYAFKGETITLGAAMHNDRCRKNLLVKVPLKTMNRHGLIAGATGTGKTKTLQILAEQLAEKGVPSLLMDIKGDLSGIAAQSPGHPKIDERHEKIGLPFISKGNPVEFLSISREQGLRLRATVSEFGPILFSKILNLNDTQTGIISLIFKYCDDHQLPLLDLKDLKKVIHYLRSDGKAELEAEYGRISGASVATIMRKMIELEQQGAEQFFGEQSFEVQDLCRKTDNGQGMITILRLTDMQDKPKLFSTVMLQLLAEIYATFPEAGDLEKPKLCLFIDEAHLVFDKATEALLNQLERIIKLIRSKGVGLVFITQNPTDIPEAVLSQLGLKIQHALRAFTAKDRRAIKTAAENYPMSPFYAIDEKLTTLGIGECFLTALNENGIPTPLVHTYLRAPQSRMDILSTAEIEAIVSQSSLQSKYNESVDRESAYELLTAKLQLANSENHQQEMKKQRASAPKDSSSRKEKSLLEKVLSNPTTRQIGNTIARELVRGLLGVLGVKSTSRRTPKKKFSWF